MCPKAAKSEQDGGSPKPESAVESLRSIHDRFKDALKGGASYRSIRESASNPDRVLRDDVIKSIRFLRANRGLYEADKRLFVKTSAMGAEIADHYGLPRLAGYAVADAGKWFSALPADLGSVKADDIEYVRECLRAYVVLAFVVYFRRGEATEALHRIQYTVRYMEKLALVSHRPMFATRAQAHRYLAEIYRSRRDFPNSKRSLAAALDYYRRRFRAEQDKRPGRNRLDIESSFAEHRMALCFVTAARTAYLDGQLDRGSEYITAARALLIRWDDPLTSATSDLILGLIRRSQSGPSDLAPLAEAEQLITGAVEVFKRVGHKPKLLWAKYELAVLQIAAHQPTAALQSLDNVVTLASKDAKKKGWAGVRSRRFTCYSYARRSRIYRELMADVRLALETAEDAVRASKSWGLFRCQIDALLVRASARLMPASDVSAAEAEADLHEALEINATAPNGSDPRFEAIAHARLAQCRIVRRDLLGAEEAFASSKKIASRMQHANLLALLQQVEDEIQRLRGGLVFSLDEVVTYAEAEGRLRRFLVRAAKMKYGTNSEAAKKLRIGESTFYKWDSEKP